MRFLLATALMTLSLGAHAAVDYKKMMAVDEAQKITRGKGVAIAVLNTGMNYDLAEFRGRVLPRNEDGSYGYDAVLNRGDAMDRFEFGLGTKVASLIAGQAYGIAPEAKLLPIRIFDEYGASDLDIVARGINMAIQSGANIIEFGGSLPNMPKAFCQALQQVDGTGQLLVLPAGNDAKETLEFPEGCTIKNAVVVTAADEHAKLADFANYGFPAIHVAAPGVKIPAMSRDGVANDDSTGTSFSAALVTGTAALVWSAHPEYTAAQVRTALIRGSAVTEGLRGKVRSNGLVNALGAIQADVSRVE